MSLIQNNLLQPRCPDSTTFNTGQQKNKTKKQKQKQTNKQKNAKCLFGITIPSKIKRDPTSDVKIRKYIAKLPMHTGIMTSTVS